MAPKGEGAASGPLRLQIALQGGGAKIVALMAAMEAVQALHPGTIQVTRVAGTSAGAIVAALFAAGVDLRQARRSLQSTLKPTIKQHFPVPSRKMLAWRLMWKGLPLWDQAAVEKILSPFFKDARVNTLGELARKTGTHIHVVASNLADGGKVTYSDETEPNKPIMSALLDSCALPYFFRVWPRFISPIVVDGGICENLPSDELIPHEAKDGPVVGLSFAPTWPDCPRNVKQFSLALLDTAISNSVARARSRLGDRVHPIVTDLTTFDFDKAAELHDDTALRIRQEASDFFTNFVSSQPREAAPTKQNMAGDPWEELSIPTMESLWEIYQSQHAEQTSQYQYCSLIVHAHSLLTDQKHVLYGVPDFVTYRVRFHPVEVTYCSTLSIVPHEGTVSLASSEFALHDQDGLPRGFVLMPARDPSQTNKRPALIFFTPPLQPKTGPYTLEFKQRVPDFMKPLLDDGKAELFLTPKRAVGSVGRIDIVLYAPKSLDSLRMGQLGGCGGTSIQPVELAQFDPAPGFRAVGWRGEDVRAGTKFGAEFFL